MSVRSLRRQVPGGVGVPGLEVLRECPRAAAPRAARGGRRPEPVDDASRTPSRFETVPHLMNQGGGGSPGGPVRPRTATLRARLNVLGVRAAWGVATVVGMATPGVQEVGAGS